MIFVIEYMLEYPGMILGALTLLVVQAICDLSLPDYMSNIVDNGVLNGNVNYILQTGGKMILITLLSAAAWSLPAILPPGSPPYARRYARGCFQARADLFPTLNSTNFRPPA